MRALLVALVLTGCDFERRQSPVQDRSIGNLRRSYDPDFGVVCYWLTTQSFSCVKADRVDGGAQ